MRTGLRLFEDLAIEQNKNTPCSKGRNTELIELRNEQMRARLYYYRTFTDKRDDVIIHLLKQEFYLTEAQILKIMYLQPHKMRELKEMRPSLAYFQKKWPHFRWQ